MQFSGLASNGVGACAVVLAFTSVEIGACAVILTSASVGVQSYWH